LYGSLNNPNDKDSCWTLEIAIPLSSIGGIAANDSIWRINFSRVQWDLKNVNGIYVKTSTKEHNWTWTPQYEISVHKPEFWGYVQFTSNAASTKTELKKDEFFDEKMELMNHYFAQRTYHKFNEKYTKLPSDLNYKNDRIIIYSAGVGFISGITKKGKTWYVNQDGRLWMQ
jgi:hypothetical protein